MRRFVVWLEKRPPLDLAFRLLGFGIFSWATFHYATISPIEAVLDGVFALLFLWMVVNFVNGF
jgi:hypothetical protein